MREKIVVGNWKMHGNLVSNKTLLDAIVSQLAGLKGAGCAVCVPSPYLFQTQFSLQNTGISWGAQNVSQHEKGAFTGEVAPAMLLDFDCKYIIVGHSERRAFFGDDDATVAAKFMAVQKAGMTPILCVGETLEEREDGITEQVVALWPNQWSPMSRCGPSVQARRPARNKRKLCTPLFAARLPAWTVVWRRI
jgi:triosephosphate isomerase